MAAEVAAGVPRSLRRGGRPHGRALASNYAREPRAYDTAAMSIAPLRTGLFVMLLAGASACERSPRPRSHAPAVLARDAVTPRDAGAPRAVPPPAAVDAGAMDARVADVATAADAHPGDAPDAVDVDTRPIGELSLDDLRLLGVAGSPDAPNAIHATPSGFGESVRRGSLVGRPERLGADASPGVRWRVARITSRRLHPEADGTLTEVPAEVAFERPNPAAPNGVEQRSLTESPADSGRNVGAIRLVGGGAGAGAAAPRSP